MRDSAEAWEDVEGPFNAFIGSSKSHPIIIHFGAGHGGYGLTIEDAKNVVSRLNAVLAKIES